MPDLPVVTSDMLADSATQPETRGIELVGDAQRHGRARDLFAVWAAPNVSILQVAIGASLILLGLELWQAILLIVLGSLSWIFVGIIAVSGPAAGTSGSVITRAIYGVVGNKLLVAITGWLIGAVYLSLNWLASSFLGASLLAQMGWPDPVWAPIAVTVVVSAITVVVAVYGAGLILKIYPVVTLALLVIFLLVTAFILPSVDWSYRPAETLSAVPLWVALTIGITVVTAAPLSFINSPDIARYLPRSTNASHIISATALGGALPCIFLMTLGSLFATGVSAASMGAGIEYALLDLLPLWLGPLLVIGVIVNTIAGNGLTTYTLSMALQAIGVPLRRIPAAVVVGVLGTALTIYLVLSTSLLGAVNLVLQFLVIVAAPTMSVFVTDVLLRRFRYDGRELFDETRDGRFWYSGGWSVPGIAAIFIGGAATALCLSTDVWEGAIAQAMGSVTLAVPVGLVVTAVVYGSLLLSPLGKQGRP